MRYATGNTEKGFMTFLRESEALKFLTINDKCYHLNLLAPAAAHYNMSGSMHNALNDWVLLFKKY